MAGIRMLKQGCFLLVILLFGLVPPTHAETQEKLVVAWSAMPKTLDPRFAVDSNGWGMNLQLIHGALVQLDYNLNIVPDLAGKWERPDSTHYIFHLRKNVRFSNGDLVTASDVKYSFDSVMDPQNKSPFLGIKDSIKSVQVIDPRTLAFEAPENMPEVTYLLSLFIPIFQKPSEEGGEPALIGAGPFQLKEKNVSEIILIPNPYYFDKKPALQQIVFKVIKDDNTRFLKFKKKDVDFAINALPPDKLNQFERKPLADTYTVLEGPALRYQYLGFNTEHPILKNKAVRQAFAHAINRDELVQYLMNNHAVKADSVLTPQNEFHAENLPQYEFSPEKASKLLDQAGFPLKEGKRFSIEYKTSTNKMRQRLGRIIKDQLKKIGVEVTIRSLEWGTFFGDVKAGNFDIYSLAWSGVSDPDFFYSAFHSSQFPPGRNRVRYVNTELDKILEAGRIEKDLEKRKAHYNKIQMILSDELPYLSLWYANNLAIVKKNIQGYRLHPTGGFHSFREIH
ncbi:MAG: ABC transporter substrate-binding protein [SAR324 cluster bacterium]|nr:ABC transporter substrate-binding protein [SAR324 cluster bacterium]